MQVRQAGEMVILRLPQRGIGTIRCGMEFHYQRRLQFAETDMAGVAHFSALLRVVEEAWHTWLAELGECVHPSAAPEGAELVGWPVAALAVDFLAPVRFAEELAVRLELAELRARTLCLGFELQTTRGATATGTLRVACVGIAADGTWSPRALPASLVAKLAPR